MAYRRRKYSRKARVPRYVRLRTKRRATVAGPAKLARYIRDTAKRTYSAMSEDKSREYFNFGRDLYSATSGPFAASNIIACNFSNSAIDILQGTGNGQRVGNKVRVKKFMMKGTLLPKGSDVNNPTPKPMQVKMYFFYDRTNPTAVPNPLADFYQFNSTSSAITGDLTDLWCPVNEDKYRLLGVRQFKIGFQEYWSGSNVASTLGTGFPNNDFKLNANFSVNLKKWLPKLVRYNDNNADATSRGLFCMVLPVWADGTVAPNTTLMARMDWMFECQYEDN